MLDTIKRLVRSVPPLYRALSLVRQSLYYSVRRHQEQLSDYRGRYWGEQRLADIRAYWDSRHDTRKNEYLLNLLRKYAPASLLELGCNCGNKLHCLAREFPDASLVGIDISRLAIEYGSRWLAEDGVSNVSLRVGRVEHLSSIPSESFDVVFSWATLIYPPPRVIAGVVANALRIARRAVVLMEMQSEHPLRGRRSAGVYCKGNWKRDYVQLIKSSSDSYAAPTVRWIPIDIWQPGGGGGAVIETVRDLRRAEHRDG